MTPKVPQQMEGQMSLVAVHPRTGEAIDLHSAVTEELLDCHDALFDLEREMKEARREVDDELIRRLDHEGRRSVSFDHFKVEANAPLEKDWDTGRLKATLEELVADGQLSADKASRCLKWDPRVVWAEVKTLLSDPRVRDQIAACFTEVDARRYLKVTRR